MMMTHNDFYSIIVTSTHNLFASGSQEDGMLKLSSVATLLIAEWRIRGDKACFAEFLERTIKFFQPIVGEKPFAKGKGIIGLVNVSKKRFGLLGPNWNVTSVPGFHVVTAVQIFHYLALASASKSLEEREN